MKSLSRFLAIVGVFFVFALSCPANATNTEKSTTIEQGDFVDLSLEVADFSTVGDGILKVENNDLAVLPSGFKIFAPKSFSGKVLEMESQSFTKIKRFPNPRDAVNYNV